MQHQILYIALFTLSACNIKTDFVLFNAEPPISVFEQIQQTPPRSQGSETQASKCDGFLRYIQLHLITIRIFLVGPPPPPSTLPPLSLQPAVVQSSPSQALSGS